MAMTIAVVMPGNLTFDQEETWTLAVAVAVRVIVQVAVVVLGRLK
jgi:hypothetical protein